MKKRNSILSLMLAVILMVTLLAACKGSESPSLSPTPPASETPSSTLPSDEPDPSPDDQEELWTGEVSKVVMTYLTAGTVPTDMLLVQEAINEITIPKIGVEVEYKPISVFEAISQFTTWIASGERMDLMMVAFTNIGNYVKQDMIDPLEGLIASNAPTIAALSGEFPVYGASEFDGSIYGVSLVAVAYGTRGCYQIDKALLESAGLADTYQDQDEITLDKLTEIFAAIKDANPDVYPCGLAPMQTGATFTGIYEKFPSTCPG